MCSCGVHVCMCACVFMCAEGSVNDKCFPQLLSETASMDAELTDSANMTACSREPRISSSSVLGL